jgi:hypothetical protein
MHDIGGARIEAGKIDPAGNLLDSKRGRHGPQIAKATDNRKGRGIVLPLIKG